MRRCGEIGATVDGVWWRELCLACGIALEAYSVEVRS